MRLAEVVGALSLAADLSSGLPLEKGLRTVLVSMRWPASSGSAPPNRRTSSG